MTKEEALKINELYKQLDELANKIRLKDEEIKKLEAQNTALKLSTNVEEMLNRIEQINKLNKQKRVNE